MKTENTIGFRSEIYDKSVTVRRNAKRNIADDSDALPVMVLSENRYYSAIFSAISEFIDEDMKGYMNSCATFSKKVDAARLLFTKDKNSLINLYRNGQCSILKA